MRRAAAIVLAMLLALAAVAPPAHACVECVALGLASFAVFTQLVSALAVPRVVYTGPGYYAPAYYAPAYYGPYGAGYGWSYPGGYHQAYAAYQAAYPAGAPAAAWAGPRIVQYPHGRYELRGDGMGIPYVWVWIPAAGPLPATPAGSVHDGPEGGGARPTP
jgi:hypothetical protein